MKIPSNPFGSRNGNGPNGEERRNPKERKKKNGGLLDIPPEVFEASAHLTEICDAIIYTSKDDEQDAVVT